MHRPSCLEMLRLALVVTPSFCISDSTPSMHLVKWRKTSCRENVSSRSWMARSHVLPISLVSLEMLSGSQKRATLCTFFVSVTIVSHCSEVAVVWRCSVVWSTKIKFGHNLEAIPILSMAEAVATLWISVTVWICGKTFRPWKRFRLRFLSTGGFRDAQLLGRIPHCLQSDDNETVYITDFVLYWCWVHYARLRHWWESWAHHSFVPQVSCHCLES